MGRRPLPALVALVVVLFALPGSASAQGLEWGECPGEGLDPRQECASLTVPLDYSAPDGETIEIAVSRIASATPADRRGVILLNPGGPGGSGIDLPTVLASTMPQQVLDRYDLVGFDPRGINFSAPVSCSLAPADLDVLKFIPYPAFDLDISENVAYSQRAAAGCAATSGELLPHNTTANTARDMDAIRAALGEERISYVGYSYGTYLGAVYAELFPDRTDRFVLDSNVNPRRIWRATFASWGYAVEIGYEAFTRFAAERDATYGLGDTPREVYETTLDGLDGLEAEPFPFPGSDLVITGDFFRELIRNDVLRDDRAFAEYAEILALIAARDSAAATDVSAGSQRLLRRANEALTPEPVPAPGVAAAADFPPVPADNGFASPWAVICGDSDWPESPSTYQRDVRAFDRLFPIHGRAAANIWPCAFWPFDPEPAVEVGELEGGNALLVQSVRDPATPYDGALVLRGTLGSRSRLVSVENGVHAISFFGVNTCADRTAAAFLATGEQPRPATFCERDPEPEAVRGATREAIEEVRHDAGVLSAAP